jgi:hypothetical protein
MPLIPADWLGYRRPFCYPERTGVPSTRLYRRGNQVRDLQLFPLGAVLAAAKQECSRQRRELGIYVLTLLQYPPVIGLSTERSRRCITSV